MGDLKDPMTDYERQREENIRKNNELLLQLDVQGVHDQLGVAAASSSKGKAPVKARSTAKPAPRVKREAVDSELPLRRSRRVSRLAVEPNETPAQKRKREKHDEELRERAEDERQAELERIREAHKPRHQDLDFAILGDDLKPAEIPKLRGLLSSLCSKKHARAVGSGTTSRDDEITADDKLEELQTQARRARVRSRAKVTTDRVYSMAYHPETSKDVVFVGDKRGGLGIWEPLAVPEEVADEDDDTVITEGGRHWLLQPHWPSTSKSSVSGIKVDPIDAHSIITSAYDCTIRQTSFTSGMSREVFALDDVLIASFDLPPNGHEMWISDVSGCLSHVDLRQDKNHARRWDVNGTGQKIGCVSVNPVTPHILATASNDRTLKLWDARKLSSLPISLSSASPSPKSRKSKKEKPEEDLPAMNETEYEEISKYLESKRGPGLLRAEHPHKLSVSSAFWDPSGRRIVSTSYDDTLRVWDIKPSSLVLDTPLKKFDPVVRRNHDCQTGRWLTILKAQWMPSPEVYPHFLVGNMNQSLDIIGCKGEPIANLGDKNLITAVQAVAACHPSRVGRYATGNASGRCVLWAAED